MKLRIKEYLPFMIAVILVTAMTALSELLEEKEILFPEIAAIACGSLISPKLSWNTDLLRVFITISIGSILGVLIVLFVPLALWLQMSLAFLIAMFMLSFSKTSFAPMISSIVLPVMLQTRSVIYPLSAMCLTAVIVLVRLSFEKAGLFHSQSFEPNDTINKKQILSLFYCWCIGSLVIVIALHFGCKYAAAPPLLVAFTEFCRPSSAVHKFPFKIAFVIVFGAASGSFFRYITVWTDIYQFLSAALTITLVYIIMQRIKMYAPPAAALSILAFLIPESTLPWYSIQVAVGASAFIAFAIVRGKLSGFIADASL